MRVLKLLSINATVFLMLLLCLNFLLAIAYGVKDYYRTVSFEDPRAELPNYAGMDWAKTHYNEFNDLPAVTFHSYYGWRRNAFESETINIDENGLRHSSTGGSDIRIGFFGGSTMWGVGARDDETIPSLVAKNLNAEVVNYGESGWRAHQSLNQLFEAFISGQTFDLVVFYDGANEVLHSCRSEQQPFSHGRQAYIAERLTSDYPSSFFAPIARFAAALSRQIKATSKSNLAKYNCSRDLDKAAYVARMLVADWDIARYISDQMGAQFIAILQPVAHLSDTPLNHLLRKIRPDLKPEYEAVYPEIRRVVREFLSNNELGFIDMTQALDNTEPVYVDWAHLSPNGNAIIADLLSGHIRKMHGTKSIRDQ